MNRTAEITRTTKETDIAIKLDLDGGAKADINTGIGFLDHMLTALAIHGGFSLELNCKGDLNVDGHHTAEDIGIVLGLAFKEALGDKAGIMRYGSAFIPMDEALAFCSLDISARPFLVFNAEFKNERVGEFDTCLTEEFMRAFAFNAGITLHLRVEYGSNDHHKIEALFKALAYALKTAVKRNADGSVVSTKGVL
jgi:imidazoleglycerol-phosphate dehydratase